MGLSMTCRREGRRNCEGREERKSRGEMTKGKNKSTRESVFCV
jgi:hypothetical protein